MAVRRHRIRKLELSRRRPLDERLWIALLCIWGLAAYGCGTYAWAIDDDLFTGQRWVPVAAVAGTIALILSLAVVSVSPRRLRRGLVVALCLSIALNLSLMVGLSYIRMLPPRRHAEVQAQPEPRREPERVFEEYYPLSLDGDDRPQQEERQPVSTGEPDMEPSDSIRRTSVAAVEALPLLPEAVVDSNQVPSIASIRRRELVTSAPRQSASQGTLSRQRLAAQPELGNSADIQVEAERSQLNATPDAAPVEPIRNAAQPFDRTFDSARPHISDVSSQTTTDSTTLQRADPPLTTPDERSAAATQSRSAMQSQFSSTSALEVPAAPAQEHATAEPAPQSTVARQDRAELPMERSAGEPANAPTRAPTWESTRAAADSRIEIAETHTSLARDPMRANHRAPAWVDVPNLEPEQAEPTESLDRIMPIPRRPARSVRMAERVSPALPEEIEDADPVTTSRAELQRAEEPGLAESGSNPPVDAAQQSGGSTELQAPVALPDPAVPARRERLTGPPRAGGDPIEIRRPRPTDPQPAPTLIVSDASLEDSHRQTGPASLPEVLIQPGGEPVEVGSQPSIAPPSSARVEATGMAEIDRPAAERLTTGRHRGHDVQPSLPTDVERPDFRTIAERESPSMLSAPSSESGRQRDPSLAAAPQPATLPVAPGLLQATAPTGPSRPDRVQWETETPSPSGIVLPTRSPTIAVEPTTSAADAIALPPPEHLAEAPPGESTVATPNVNTPAPPKRSLSAVVGERNAIAPQVQSLADSPIPSSTVVPSHGDQDPQPQIADSVTEANASRTRLDANISPAGNVAATPPNSADPGTTASAMELSSRPTPADRRAVGALPVEVEARSGLGGYSSDVAPDIGSLVRRSQPDSDQIAESDGRFIRRPVGGPISIDRYVPIPARAYQSRMNRRGDRPVGGNNRPSPRTEEAIELGLLYLTDHQRGNGSWSFESAGEPADAPPSRRPSIRADTAATGLALLSFLGAGYHHRSEDHGQTVYNGLNYLIAHQRPNGDLYLPSDPSSNDSAWLYSHAIASIALSEAYGMTQDPWLREPAQRAIDFITRAQHPERGGWRYAPGVGSDTSVSGWMVMGLRSAELANLQVPVAAWQGVDVWLNMAQMSRERPELYRYNPLAPNTVTQGHGRRPSRSMTAVGLLMRLYTGWRRDDLTMKAGASYLANHLPELGTIRDPQRDTYYWYYATQVMFHMGGDYWERWNNSLHELLVSTQLQIGPLAGSWDPWAPLPDRWAIHAGRLYVTTMNLLSLEVYYRHLPIYEEVGH